MHAQLYFGREQIVSTYRYFSFPREVRREMRLLGGLGTLAFNLILLIVLPALYIALLGLVFYLGVLFTVFDFKSMK